MFSFDGPIYSKESDGWNFKWEADKHGPLKYFKRSLMKAYWELGNENHKPCLHVFI